MAAWCGRQPRRSAGAGQHSVCVDLAGLGRGTSTPPSEKFGHRETPIGRAYKLK